MKESIVKKPIKVRVGYEISNIQEPQAKDAIALLDYLNTLLKESDGYMTGQNIIQAFDGMVDFPEDSADTHHHFTILADLTSEQINGLNASGLDGVIIDAPGGRTVELDIDVKIVYKRSVPKKDSPFRSGILKRCIELLRILSDSNKPTHFEISCNTEKFHNN